MNKNSNNKSNTLQVFWVMFGSLSAIALALVSSAILSRYLDKQQYGTYRQILYVYTTLSIIFSAGLPRVFAYFLPRYSLAQGKSIVFKVTSFLFLTGFLFSCFLYLFSGVIAQVLNNAELEIGLKTFAIIPTLLLPTLGIQGIFSTYRKTIYIAIYNTLSKLLTLMFIVLPVVLFDGSYITALYGWIVVSFITLFIALLFKRIPFKKVKPVKADLTFKEIFAYSIPLVIASFWGISISAADQFFISKYFGTEIFAEFANGFIEVPFVGMVTSSAAVVLMPIFSKMIHDKANKQEIIVLWSNILNKSALIIYPLVVFIMFFAKEIMILIYSEKYTASASYFQINIIFNFFNIIVFAPLLLAMGKTKLYANVHMFLAIGIWSLGYVVIYVFNSPIAIAVLSVAFRIIKIIIFTFIISRVLKVHILSLFPVKKLLSIIFHAGSIGILIWFLYHYFLIFDLPLLKLGISFLFFCGLLLATSRFVRIDYMIVLKPLIQKAKQYLTN